MRNFTKMKFWMLLMVMGLAVSSAFAQGPKLEITPTSLDLGEWPIGGWQENAYLELKNAGSGVVTINASDLDDPDGNFSLTPLSLPYTLSALGDAVQVGVGFVGTGVADGVYNTTYVAAWNGSKSVTTADITVSAYTATVGDIVENPFVVTLPATAAGVSTALPMRSNYVLPGAATNGKDVVYKFTLADDEEVDVAVTAATKTPKMALYAAGFGGEGGPMVTNALFSGDDTFTDLPLYAGDYYLVVSCVEDDADMTFDISISGTVMPDPEKAFNPTPADGAIDIPSNGLTLTWDFGQYTNEYQVSFGTTYPPSDVVVPWTAVTPTGSFALPNLNPSMQYFWRVDVRNNNGDVTGDVWGFTTTLTAPSNLTATVVEQSTMGVYDVKLHWDASAKALLSYNVYRDGAKIGTTAVGTTDYTDVAVAYNTNPCYEYQVEAVFDEGVSAMSNTASACITGIGTIDGVVTELLTGNPIEGAEVKVTSTSGWSTTATTDIVGHYSTSVYEGTYNYEVSADGYITETLDAIDVDYNTTVTKDFQLDEFPYPVADVIATEVNDNTVQVDWSGTGGGNIAEWLFYDDGTNVDAIGGPATFTWATKFDASQLVDFPGSSVTKFQMYCKTNETLHFIVMQGDNAETVIYTEDFSGVTVDAWNEFTLSTPAAFDNTQALWFGIYTEQGTNYPASCGADMGIPNGDLITLDGTTWAHLSDYSLNYTWNLRGFVTDASGKSYSMAKVNTPEYAKIPEGDFTAANVAPKGNATIPASADFSSKDVTGYNVYRQDCAGTTAMQFLGMTLDQQFTDNTWGAAGWGTYRWAVEVIYTNNTSAPAYSNCLDKDMVAAVDVTVTTNSGDAPEGCDVKFENISEPALALTYETTLEGTNTHAWSDFRKGTYNITVSLTGFGELTFTDVLIDSDTSFVWQLEELLAPPTDLYVTPLGFATWKSSTVVFEPFMENFDTQEQFDLWEVIHNGSSSETWHWVTASNNGNTLDGTPFAYVDADAGGSGVTMDEILISPVIDASMVSELVLEFDIVHQQIGDHVDIDVYDGNDWVNVGVSDSDSGPYPWGPTAHMTFDVSAYANADFRVRFHYVAGWDWFVGIDNVSVHDNSGKYADGKEFQKYKVFHDGVFSADTDTNFYQYGDNGEVLVPGTTYLAEVATLYSTGLSTKASYSWTYLPCDSFPNFNAMNADLVEGSDDDVLVNWTDVIPMELVTITQNPGDPSNGYYQQYGYGYGVAYDFSSYPDALVNSVEFHHASWGVTGTWDYNIHIIDWDTKTVLAVVGPLQTTGDDKWEMGVELGDVSTGGAASVALLMEPLSNDAADAYPCISSDSDTDPQGSIFGDLADLAAMGSSTVGNFLMNVTIYTANGGGKMAPVVMNNNEAPAAKARIATNNTFNANQIVMQEEVSTKAAAAVTSLGANVYRDGEMIAFVADPDTFYLDNDLEPGYYDYCVAKVYTADGGDHTWTACPGSLCVEDVYVPEDCGAPEELTAEDLLGDGFTATLNWLPAGGNFDPVWLQYDDGVNVDGIGGPAEFTYASKWDASQLVDYDGTAITQVKLFPREAGTSFTLKIWKGANAGTLLLEQPLTGLTFDDWNTITLDTPVDIDITEELWVGFYVVTSGYPAGCGNYCGDANSDLITLDGSTWGHLADYSLNYSWNMGAYVESAKGVSMALPGIVDHATYSSNKAAIAAGNLPVSENAIDETAGAKEFLGYNVYRDGNKINEDLVLETTYLDVLDASVYHCYKVTAVYSVCGESDFSNEACVQPGVGVGEIENNVSVYPNPASDFVKVEANSDIRSIVVTNYMGQIVRSIKSVEFTQFTIETSDLSAGVYFVEVETQAGIEKVRIVISK